MSKKLTIKVEKDHIESLISASPVKAIEELIWNGLDADASNVEIQYIEGENRIRQIIVKDNGHGIEYQVAQNAFGSLGGSDKKLRIHSPNDRVLHGKEGKGRLKAFVLGDLITFESFYNSKGYSKFFTIKLDRNNIKTSIISDLKSRRKRETEPGVTVKIDNINQANSSKLFHNNAIKTLEERFALYYMSYPDFKITVNKIPLDFSSVIKNIFESKKIKIAEQGKIEEFEIKIIEWKKEIERKLYYCNNKGICFLENRLGVRTYGYPITVYIQSKYIEELHRENKLNVGELDRILFQVTQEAKEITKKYILDRKHEEAQNYIDQLKEEEIYPFKFPPVDEVDKLKRKAFDIVALQINDYVPDFNKQDKKSKQFTLSLVKEALERDSTNLQKIFEEVINLPKGKREELRDILDKTSLSVIIDTMKEITDRLRLIYELGLILFDKKYNKEVLERKHLHQIVKNESWIFGDDYTYGVDDITLKNVLKAYLQYLGRNDFEEVINSKDNKNLGDIPDICLWKQYSLGKAGHFENLVIELKRPTKTISLTELDQIKKYARRVSADERFPMDRTKWTFILLSTKLNDDALFECEQDDREFGHIFSKKNIDVFVVRWGDLLNKAEARHQYIKEKLNYNISENDEGINLLKEKYSQYLPN